MCLCDMLLGLLVCASSEDSRAAEGLELLVSAGKMMKDNAIDYRQVTLTSTIYG